MRIPKTFTLEESILADVERSRGGRSASDRVNELLKRGLDQEKRDELERDAAHFYALKRQKNRSEERASQKAAVRSFTRE